MKKFFSFISMTLALLGLFFLFRYFSEVKIDSSEPIEIVNPAFVPEAIAATKTSKEYYISPEGDDSNVGLSLATAVKTIQKAVDISVTGDIIHLPDGTSLTVHKQVSQVMPETVSNSAKSYFVSPSGSDANDGLSISTSFKTIQKAVDLAQPGETINLADGEYLQDIISKRNGKSDAPITISGTKKAIIKGGGNGRVIEINHDYITLDGFTVDGFFGSKDKATSYRDKLIYALGKEKKDGVTGLKLKNMQIKNAGGECVRLRYFAQKNEIVNNLITNCGVLDFKFKGGGKNGEGIYIGTAPEQLKDGKNPTIDPDQSNDNWIHDNVIDTQGNECVDIKEASSGNIVEKNKCTGQKDPESAGLDARGSGNIFRNNQIFGCVGSGVRLGGDGKTDGTNNLVSKNTIRDNKNGGVKVMRSPQVICGNTVTNCGAGVCVGDFAKKFDPTSVCAP